MKVKKNGHRASACGNGTRKMKLMKMERLSFQRVHSCLDNRKGISMARPNRSMVAKELVCVPASLVPDFISRVVSQRVKPEERKGAEVMGLRSRGLDDRAP